MCQVDENGVAQCQAFAAAPLYKGRRLDFLSHDLEENKLPIEEGMIGAFTAASTHGSRERTIELLVQNRNHNFVSQLKYEGQNLANRDGPWFFGRDLWQGYLDGTSHALPNIPYLGQHLMAELRVRRYKKVRHRAARGLSREAITTYPEWPSFLARIENELATSQQLRERLLGEFDLRAPADFYFPSIRFSRFLDLRLNRFFEYLDQRRQPEAVLLMEVLDSEDRETYCLFQAEVAELAAKNPKRGMKKHCYNAKRQLKLHNTNWNLRLSQKYRSAFKEKLWEAIAPQVLLLPPVELQQAA